MPGRPGQMEQKFSFEIDPLWGLIRIRMIGFYTLEDIEAFREARRAAHEALGWPRNQHMTLNDLREMKVQPQDTVAAFREMLADPAYHSRKLAFVVSPTLARGQLTRALLGRSAQLFEDVESAEAYLFADEDRERVRRFG